MKAWQPISNPIMSPVQYKFLLNAGQKVDFKVAGYNKNSGKYSSYANLGGGVTGVRPPATPAPGPMQLCSKTAQPATPTNFRVKSNVYNPSKKYAEVLLEWNQPSGNANAGCVKMFTVQSFQANGGMKDNKMVDNPAQTYFTHQRNLNTGVSSKYEVQAVGYDGKVSGKAVINSVVGAGASVVPAGRKML
jgi:hypothetical protein